VDSKIAQDPIAKLLVRDKLFKKIPDRTYVMSIVGQNSNLDDWLRVNGFPSRTNVAISFTMVAAWLWAANFIT
jgi:hypothetical protein